MPAPNVDEALEAIVAPLREQMQGIEKEITELEAQLGDLRATRTKVGRVLHQLDPQWAADHANRRPQKPNEYRIAPQTLDGFYSYLAEHFKGQKITSPRIIARPDAPLAKAGITAGLRRLRDQGKLRLDRVGDESGNRTKVYRLANE